jgi:tetratricopeptide (TPR) repeat protein
MVLKLIARGRMKRKVVKVGMLLCDLPAPQDPAVKDCFAREAMVLLEQLLTEYPNNRAGNFYYGMFLCQHYQNYKAAVGPLKRAIDSFPGDCFAHGFLAKSLDALGDTTGAFVHYQTALSIQPDDVFANWLLGNHLVRHKKDFVGAIKLFTKTLAADPHHGSCMIDLAKAHQARKEYREAISWYRRAMRTTFVESPNCDYVPNESDDAHYNLGILLIDHGTVDEALESFKMATILAPNDAYNHTSLAMMLLRGKNDLRGGMEAFDQAIACSPPLDLLCNLYFDFGCYLANYCHLPEAVNCYRKTIELAHLVTADTARIINGFAFDPRLRLVQCLVYIGDVSGAISAFRDMLKVESDSDDVKLAARTLDAAKTAKRDNIEKILRKCPVTVQCSIMFDVGVGRQALRNAKGSDGAIDAWKMVVRLQPDHAGAHGKLCYELGSRARWREGYRGDYTHAIAAGLAHTELLPGDYHAHWYHACAMSSYIRHDLHVELQKATSDSAVKLHIRQQGTIEMWDAKLNKILDQVDAMGLLAVRAFERALEINPTDVSLYISANNLLSTTGNPESALAWLAAAIRIDYDVGVKSVQFADNSDPSLNDPQPEPIWNPALFDEAGSVELPDVLGAPASSRWPSNHDTIEWPDGRSKFCSREDDLQLLKEVGTQQLERKRMSREDPVLWNHWHNHCHQPGDPKQNFIRPPLAGEDKAVLRFRDGTVSSKLHF